MCSACCEGQRKGMFKELLLHLSLHAVSYNIFSSVIFCICLTECAIKCHFIVFSPSAWEFGLSLLVFTKLFIHVHVQRRVCVQLPSVVLWLTGKIFHTFRLGTASVPKVAHTRQESSKVQVIHI